MPGSRDKLVSQAELDILVQQIIKRMASAGGGGGMPEAGDEGQVLQTLSGVASWGLTIYISDSAPDGGLGVNGDIHLEY